MVQKKEQFGCQQFHRYVLPVPESVKTARQQACTVINQYIKYITPVIRTARSTGRYRRREFPRRFCISAFL